jgi:site-specific DNA-adenine methylase
MKNHFIIPYAGNKREEVKQILNNLNDKYPGWEEKTSTIVEPFCGSSAFSYYLSTLYPGKFKYILNDNDAHLIELYHTMKDEKRYEAFKTKMNSLIASINSKDEYKQVISKKDFYGWFVARFWYGYRQGVYNEERKKLITSDCNIITFLRNENVKITNEDGIDVYKKYKDDESTLLFIDPPYMNLFNGLYYDDKSGLNLYEYMYENSIKDEKSIIVLALALTFFVKLIFKDYINDSYIYGKMYNLTQRKVSHVTIIN